MSESEKLQIEEIEKVNTRAELKVLIKEKGISFNKAEKTLLYNEELRDLQIELVKLQHWVAKENKRIAIIFEGRDAAGKGGNIRRFMEHLNPRSTRLVALSKPTYTERGQWYFQRYIKELPNHGEIVFFDRSWYNRAVVEPVMGFCEDNQYKNFLAQVLEFERMLYEDGLIIIKFWLSISKDEQLRRFNARKNNPLKRWKFSSVDKKGQELWNSYSLYKEEMFNKTHTTYSPWMIVKTNSKKAARLESIRYVLSQFDYCNKKLVPTKLFPNPNIVMSYYTNLNTKCRT